MARKLGKVINDFNDAKALQKAAKLGKNILYVGTTLGVIAANTLFPTAAMADDMNATGPGFDQDTTVIVDDGNESSAGSNPDLANDDNIAVGPDTGLVVGDPESSTVGGQPDLVWGEEESVDDDNNIAVGPPATNTSIVSNQLDLIGQQEAIAVNDGEHEGEQQNPRTWLNEQPPKGLNNGGSGNKDKEDKDKNNGNISDQDKYKDLVVIGYTKNGDPVYGPVTAPTETETVDTTQTPPPAADPAPKQKSPTPPKSGSGASGGSSTSGKGGSATTGDIEGSFNYYKDSFNNYYIIVDGRYIPIAIDDGISPDKILAMTEEVPQKKTSIPPLGWAGIGAAAVGALVVASKHGERTAEIKGYRERIR